MSTDFPLRTDAYQTAKSATAVLYIRGHIIDNLQVHPESKSLAVEVEVDGENCVKVWAWYSEVDPSTVKVDRGSVKIEISVTKVSQVMWPKVESTPEEVIPLYERWSKVTLPAEEEEKGEGGVTQFLRKCYADADEDSRRAMMKSMVESHGTVFNGNWKEVGKKTVEPYKSKEEKEAEEAEKQKEKGESD
jgi:suppressor of G2 allele of SKP1